KGLIEKAAVLFYLMIKNHPFTNGNKRIAVTALLVFLALNGKWLKVTNQELYNFSVWVASSPPQVMNQTVAAVGEFVSKNLKDY
ncbi:MAG: type II toxin-antitoxin system death-on-curing family toxin, partial [Candidatus Altiarchaeota archaeon]|nr:type II toxin-antitoxin system death-on-curing family toxin [Candidatus Altiarchaeota archaeon]